MIPNRSKLQSALTDAHEFIIWSILGNKKKPTTKKEFLSIFKKPRKIYPRGRTVLTFLIFLFQTTFTQHVHWQQDLVSYLALYPRSKWLYRQLLLIRGTILKTTISFGIQLTDSQDSPPLETVEVTCCLVLEPGHIGLYSCQFLATSIHITPYLL